MTFNQQNSFLINQFYQHIEKTPKNFDNQITTKALKKSNLIKVIGTQNCPYTLTPLIHDLNVNNMREKSHILNGKN